MNFAYYTSSLFGTQPTPKNQYLLFSLCYSTILLLLTIFLDFFTFSFYYSTFCRFFFFFLTYLSGSPVVPSFIHALAQKAAMANSTPSSKSSNLTVLDNACTSHLSSSFCGFQKDTRPFVTPIKLANGSCMYSTHIGTKVVTTFSKDGAHLSVLLHRCLYVPGMPHCYRLCVVLVSIV